MDDGNEETTLENLEICKIFFSSQGDHDKQRGARGKDWNSDHKKEKTSPKLEFENFSIEG